MVVFSVGEVMVLVKVVLQVVALFMFQLDTIIAVVLILMVVFSVGEEIQKNNQLHPPISAPGTVVNNSADSTTTPFPTKLYSY